MNNKLTFLYDGECPFCLRETNFLKKKDNKNSILFIDISKKGFNPIRFQNITYMDAMSNLHGILNNGRIIRGLDVLAYSYELIGLGWIYYPIKIPYLANLLKFLYKYWAHNRLAITRRSNLETLCSKKCISIK